VAVTLLFTGYHRHPKMMVANGIAGDERAEVLWTRGLDYANEHGTDGFIPKGVPQILTPTKTAARIKALVQAGLWDEVEGGWQFHDFLEWNRTAEQLDARKAAISKKRSEAGKAGARVRWQGRLPFDASSNEVAGR
jgi:hypothetical protein